MYVGYGVEVKGVLSEEDEKEIRNTLKSSLLSIQKRVGYQSEILENEKRNGRLSKLVMLVDVGEIEDDRKLRGILADLDSNVYLSLYPYDVGYNLVVDRKVLRGLSGLFARAKALGPSHLNEVKQIQSEINEILSSYGLL